ncbi:MAG: OmpA family protein [Flavobacteriales bacterium]|nr:OmpA family protein [Flavobacteriales bacterium]
MSQHFKIILTLFLFNWSFGFAQNADCDKLLKLTDTIYQAKNISGFGQKLEFKNNFNDDISSFPEEANSIWYLFKVPATGNFTFDIVSNNELDDWDFLLFEHKSQFCRRIDSNRIKPIRANLSRSSTTGLSLTSTQEFSMPGVNNNYSKYVSAKEGDEFVLVVNNPKKANSNHTLLLHFPKVKKMVEPVVEQVKVEEIKDTPKLNFTIDISDAATKQPISANVTISGLRKENVELNNITNYQAIIEKTMYRINLTVATEGYMLYSTKININKSKDQFHQAVALERIVEGKNVSLDDIQFQPASDKFLKTAESSLKSLLNFMELNKSVKIEIEGHVNGPGQSNHNEFKKLSIDRANAVKDYLTSNGIELSRLQCTGYGNSKMIYPDPKIEDEHSANRRVEIKIISK